MNYIAEINAFEQWVSTHPLPRDSQLLWYKLMALFNKSYWAEWICVDNLRLMAEMQIKREASFIKIRDNLISAGLVGFIKGKKGSPNQYRMVSLSNLAVKSVTESEANTVINTVAETEVQTADIYKQNNTKQNKNKTDIVSKSDEILMTDEQQQNQISEFGENAFYSVKNRLIDWKSKKNISGIDDYGLVTKILKQDYELKKDCVDNSSSFNIDEIYNMSLEKYKA